MSPPEDLLGVIAVMADICDRLKVQYAIGGAIAQNFWGTVRATQDVDLLVALPRVRFEEVRRLLDEAGFTARDEEGAPATISVERIAAEERERHLFTVYHSLVKVEVFLPFLPLQHSILRRAVVLELGGRRVPVTTAEDLVILKMVFHREKDIRDVRAILWNRRRKLELGYIRTWSSSMLSPEHLQELEELIRAYAE